MNWRKVLAYGVLALVVLFALQVALSVVLDVFSFLWTVLTTAVTLLVIGGLLYGGYRLWSWSRDTESSSASDSVEAPKSPENRIETLKERYARGEISEAELERRLDQEFGGPSMDRFDRRLERERE